MDGGSVITPVAEVQKLAPLDVKFVSSSVWSEENRTAGSSTLTLLLLGLLGIVLAGEQLLAYLASYHVKPDAVRKVYGRLPPSCPSRRSPLQF